MSTPDPNREAIELVSARLEPRLDEFLFVGGAATGLLLTDPAARRPRASKDVDVVVRVASLASFDRHVRPFLVERGFREDSSPGASICRWIVEDVLVDVMLTDSSILGFTNRWFDQAFSCARPHEVGSRNILLPAAPLFVAMKLEAFAGRGQGDYYGSDDVEDLLTVIDGRGELVGEIEAADPEVREFISGSLSTWLADPEFQNALPGHCDPGRDATVLGRLEQIAGSP